MSGVPMGGFVQECFTEGCVVVGCEGLYLGEIRKVVYCDMMYWVVQKCVAGGCRRLSPSKLCYDVLCSCGLDCKSLCCSGGLSNVGSYCSEL